MTPDDLRQTAIEYARSNLWDVATALERAADRLESLERAVREAHAALLHTGGVSRPSEIQAGIDAARAILSRALPTEKGTSDG